MPKPLSGRSGRGIPSARIRCRRRRPQAAPPAANPGRGAGAWIHPRPHCSVEGATPRSTSDLDHRCGRIRSAPETRDRAVTRPGSTPRATICFRVLRILLVPLKRLVAHEHGVVSMDGRDSFAYLRVGIYPSFLRKCRMVPMAASGPVPPCSPAVPSWIPAAPASRRRRDDGPCGAASPCAPFDKLRDSIKLRTGRLRPGFPVIPAKAGIQLFSRPPGAGRMLQAKKQQRRWPGSSEPGVWH